MKYRCGVCGYVADDSAPEKCPNCGAPQARFDSINPGDDLLKIVDYNKIGAAKGTGFEEDMKMQYQGECSEVGMYIAMARQAEREGYSEVAETMKRIAWEEAHHAARFCELFGGISESTRENLEKLVAGESAANAAKKLIAVRSKQQNVDAVHDATHEACKDEARHAAAFYGLLKRYFTA